jgi:peptidoglycan/LPS O-acetylase OafA/YrhL
MNEEELSDESSRDEHRSGRCRGGLGWADIGMSALVILVISVPTMVVEEDWHGRPMIDEPTHLWIIATCLVATAFLVGGVVAGHRRPSAAPEHATAAASLAVTVLLVAAILRRLCLAHEGVPVGVVGLWCLGVVAAIFLSAAGSVLGRRLTADAHGGSRHPHQHGHRGTGRRF